MSGNDEDQNIINVEIPKLSRHSYKKQQLQQKQIKYRA